MPAITLPDGSVRRFDGPVTGTEVAAAIGPGLAKAAVAMSVDGKLSDLGRRLDHDAAVRFVTRKDPEALELIRHDAAHVLAEAVQDLFPGTQVTIGPPIDNGFYYDFHREQPFTPEDFPAIEARMREIVARNAAFTREPVDRSAAIDLFKQKGERFKVELIEDLPPSEQITLYRQGDWVDLCRGPHMRSTGDVGNAFKLMKVAGAYWRGDHRNPVLSRIYGTAWRDAKELEAHLHQLEEAERRDHRRIGKEMHLFHIQEEAVGSVFWHPKGWKLYRTVEDYMRRRLDAAEYQEVRTPQLVDRKLWIESGHWEKFREHMFICTVEDEAEKDRVLALKPMNCPGHVQIFNQGIRSYRELPYRMAEFGSCHRYEPSGALHGIMRVRAFTQDDAHIFCTEGQIADETVKFVALLSAIYRDLGFPEFRVKFSDRPAVRSGTDAVWDQAEGALREACAVAGVEYELNPGEGAFYGPEAGVRAARRHRPRLAVRHPPGGLRPARAPRRRVHAEDGSRRRPVMLHRAILGSFERFLGILIEQHAGRFPLWLRPCRRWWRPSWTTRRPSRAKRRRRWPKRGCGWTSTSATRRSTARSWTTSTSACPCWRDRPARGGGAQRGPAPPAGREQETLPLAEAVARLAAEAKPPG
jgi:threonyl-tRNA synthetase